MNQRMSSLVAFAIFILMVVTLTVVYGVGYWLPGF